MVYNIRAGVEIGEKRNEKENVRNIIYAETIVNSIRCKLSRIFNKVLLLFIHFVLVTANSAKRNRRLFMVLPFY